jgi:hypothetical protein
MNKRNTSRRNKNQSAIKRRNLSSTSKNKRK